MVSEPTPKPRGETPAEPQAAVPERQRRRRSSAGGFALKLDAEQRPGFTRRFVNADPSRIRQMEELGYSIVTGAEESGSNRTDGLGSAISRHAGSDKEGKPFHTILMETPNNLYAEGELEKEGERRKFEEAINRGLKTEDTPEGAYIPKGSPQQAITRSG